MKSTVSFYLIQSNLKVSVEAFAVCCLHIPDSHHHLAKSSKRGCQIWHGKFSLSASMEPYSSKMKKKTVSKKVIDTNQYHFLLECGKMDERYSKEWILPHPAVLYC